MRFDQVPVSQRPYWVRPDLAPFLIHLTKEIEGRSARDNLIRILKEGRIRGTDAYIQGSRKAASFMDVPFIALKNICTEENRRRYEPYGIVVSKSSAYRLGVRPVLYLSNEERNRLAIPDEELWRVVRFEGRFGRVDWLHEREWRCAEGFQLPRGFGVLVNTVQDVHVLERELVRRRNDFTSVPAIIMPLSLVCQGLVF